MTPFGYLFLDEPLIEKLNIPDFRIKADRVPARPSPNLIDTLPPRSIFTSDFN